MPLATTRAREFDVPPRGNEWVDWRVKSRPHVTLILVQEAGASRRELGRIESDSECLRRFSKEPFHTAAITLDFLSASRGQLRRQIFIGVEFE